MVGQTQAIRSQDRIRFSAFHEIGCIMCALEDRVGMGVVTVQHVVEANRRIEDDDGNQHAMTYPACRWHHLGEVPYNCKGSPNKATMYYGPSLQHSKREFETRYGTERQLIDITDAMVRMVMDNRRKGEYLPPRQTKRLIQQLHREIVQRDPPSNGWQNEVCYPT